jgi:hypothetical protein
MMATGNRAHYYRNQRDQHDQLQCIETNLQKDLFIRGGPEYHSLQVLAPVAHSRQVIRTKTSQTCSAEAH